MTLWVIYRHNGMHHYSDDCTDTSDLSGSDEDDDFPLNLGEFQNKESVSSSSLYQLLANERSRQKLTNNSQILSRSVSPNIDKVNDAIKPDDFENTDDLSTQVSHRPSIV
ncbi:hypothetical protein BDA99DRAFT_566819 [Phascolomyces articulosus]|uniref:Uncharacterized protein n=1 Tax=Phascolomyces articulosus TaxID=60185 RepID=A0AAD5P709_9FUNG|nr:hypothetical protein BDA99DRAFT_566819 [Phascolomyces articulosus]